MVVVEPGGGECKRVRRSGAASTECDERGIEVAIERVGPVAAVGKDAMEERCWCERGIKAGGETQGGFAAGAPGQTDARLPLFQIVRYALDGGRSSE